MTVARLGYEIDSSQARSAAVDLDRMAQSADRAQRSERGLATTSKQAGTATGQLARQARDASTATAQLERATEMVAAAQGRQVAATNASTVALHAQAVAVSRNTMLSLQLMFQLVDIGQAIPLAFQSPIYALQNFGFQIAQIGQLYYGQGGMRAALRDSISMVGRFASRIGPAALAVGAVAAAIAGMTYEINQASDVTVSFGDTALAVWQVFRDGVYDIAQPAIRELAPWFAAAWDGVVAGVHTAGNLIINSFRAAFADIKFVWSNLPAIMGAATIGAANAVISGVESMINRAIGLINSLIGQVNGLLSSIPGAEDLQIGTIGDVSIGRIDNAPAENLRSAVEAHVSNFQSIMGDDPLGGFFNAVSIRATQNALAGVEDAAGGAGKALREAADNAKGPWDEINQKVQQAQDTLAKDWGGLLRQIVDGTLDWRDAIIEAGTALLRYLNEANIAAGGSGIFGGGFIGTLINAFLGFAKGGVISQGNVVPFARGGIVTRPTVFPMANGAGLMGEAGPEAIMPLRRGPDGRLGVSAPRMAANDQPLRLEIVSRFDADGGFHTAVERASRPIAQQESAEAASRVARAVPSMVDARTEEREFRRIRPRSAA